MGSVADSERDGAAVVIPPPLVFLAAIVVAVVMGWLWPRGVWFDAPLRYVVGGVGLLASGWLLSGAIGQFKRMDQDPKPWRPTPAITEAGPYRFTRNPMYLGFAAFTVGLGFVLGNGWFVPAALLAALAVQRTAIVHEEAYLERKFGEAYLAYKRRVRRWL